GLQRVPAAGGKPEPITKLKEGRESTHRWPQVLSGGQNILFTAAYGNDFDASTIRAVSIKTGESKELVTGGTYARFVPVRGRKGYLLYLHKGTMFTVPFDSESLSVQGAAVPVLEEIRTSGTGGGNVGIANNGTVFFERGRLASYHLVSYDREGKRERLF